MNLVPQLPIDLMWLRIPTTTTTRTWRSTSWLLLLLCLVTTASASIGDRSYAYRRCVASCVTGVCSDYNSPPLPLSLRLTFWSCPDDCSYSCMHNLTSLSMSPSLSYEQKLRELPGLPPNRVVQYHGKWPFYRFFGIQEPLSVLFSLMNMYMHVKFGLLSFRHRLPSDFPKPLRKAYSYVPLAGINLWIWSTVFHTRDKPWTEKMDYFSAAASTMCNLSVAVIRLGGLYPPLGQPGSRRGATARPLLLFLLSAIFVCHISYLTFWRFDYGYNMVFNITIGLLHNLLWSAWSLYQFFFSPSSSHSLSASTPSPSSKYRAKHYAQPFLVLTFFSSLMALELLDFPPLLRTLDAHALWHLSTVVVIKWWYECLVRDAWWLVGREGEYTDGKRGRKDSGKGLRLA